jgi:hypothetical protein
VRCYGLGIRNDVETAEVLLAGASKGSSSNNHPTSDAARRDWPIIPRFEPEELVVLWFKKILKFAESRFNVHAFTFKYHPLPVSQ